MLETQAIVVTPAQGIYRNVPAAEYHAWNAVNKSSMDVLVERSPLHYHYALTHPEPQTAAMLIGSAIHCLILDGDEAYASEFIVGGPINPKTGQSYGRDTQAFEKWAAEQGPGNKFLTVSQDAMIRAMAESVLRDETAREMIVGDGQNRDDNEVSLVWKDPETGVVCKGRADMIRPKWESITDIKTTEDAGPKGFSRSICDYGYHRQAAWYLDGAKTLGLPVRLFVFMCVEKSPPHATAAYCLLPSDIEIGRQQNRKALATIAACRASGYWPGYDTGFADIGMRAGAARESLRELAEDFA